MFDRSILYFIINLENKKKASLLDLMNKLGQKIVRIIIIKKYSKDASGQENISFDLI